MNEAIETMFRPPPRNHASNDDGKYQRQKPIDYRILPNNMFSITVNKSKGLGVSLGLTKDSDIVVNNFKDTKYGNWGELEASGLVGLADVLFAVNDQRVDGL